MRGSRTSIYGFQCHHQQASAAVDAAADADAKHHTFQTCNLLPHTTLFNSMDPVQALKNLQGMGFCLAACERALRVSDNSLDRCAWHGLIWSGIIQGFKVMVSNNGNLCAQGTRLAAGKSHGSFRRSVRRERGARPNTTANSQQMNTAAN